jgi:hypothetical protein
MWLPIEIVILRDVLPVMAYAAQTAAWEIKTPGRF